MGGGIGEARKEPDEAGGKKKEPGRLVCYELTRLPARNKIPYACGVRSSERRL